MAEFVEYCQQLIACRRLDILWSNLRFLRLRACSRPGWHAAFNAALHTLQVHTCASVPSLMMFQNDVDAKRGGKLPIDAL